MQIAIPLFPQVTALDAVGPYEVLQRLPDATVTFVGHEVGVVRTDNGFLGLHVDARVEDVARPDVVVVPGGIGTLLLGAAGLLEGLTAATHWSTYDVLARTGAVPTPQRVVEHLDRRILTAAGVSSGIDMALRLAELLVDGTAAKAMQLMIEYDPQPPFDAGNVAAAGDEVLARVAEYSATKQ